MNELNILHFQMNSASVKEPNGLSITGASIAELKIDFNFREGGVWSWQASTLIGWTEIQSAVAASLCPAPIEKGADYWAVNGIIARSARMGPSSVMAVSRNGKRRRSSLIQPRN